jgi:UDP-glucose 4-epimerase
VTGGAGFIGSHLCKQLLKQGWGVHVVDNLSSGYRENIPSGATFQLMDLSMEDRIEELSADGVEVVFHLASHVGQELSFERPVYDFNSNALSTLLLLKWCQKNNVKQFIFASSMNIYGDPPVECVTEKTQIQPPSPYSVGKISSEYLCNVYEEYAGIKTTSLRLFNVYGPMQDMHNMKQGMVSIFMSFVARGEAVHVRGLGDRFRDFIFVDDVVDAFIKCLDEKAKGKIYNVSTGRKTLVNSLIREIIFAYGEDPDTYPITFGDPTPRDQFGIYGNSDLLIAELGWQPTVELQDGLRIMAEWVKTAYKKDKDLLT